MSGTVADHDDTVAHARGLLWRTYEAQGSGVREKLQMRKFSAASMIVSPAESFHPSSPRPPFPCYLLPATLGSPCVPRVVTLDSLLYAVAVLAMNATGRILSGVVKVGEAPVIIRRVPCSNAAVTVLGA